MSLSIVELCVAAYEPGCLRHPRRAVQASEADASWKTADQSHDYKHGTRPGARSRWHCWSRRPSFCTFTSCWKPEAYRLHGGKFRGWYGAVHINIRNWQILNLLTTCKSSGIVCWQCSSVSLFVCSFICRMKCVLVGHWLAWPSRANGRSTGWPHRPMGVLDVSSPWKTSPPQWNLC